MDIDPVARPILLVDDDIELCDLIREYLASEGFEVRLEHSGRRGAERAVSDEYSLVILDVMLPELNGFDVLRQIRARSSVPVLMLTAKGEDIDRIVGLEMGADDYLGKPFNPRELLARLRAILRRSTGGGPAGGENAPDHLKLGDLELDQGTRRVTRSGDALELTSVEFDLLDCFLRSAGRVLRREELVESVLGRNFQPYDRSIDVHVSNLRRKLGRHPSGNERIKSVRSVGYQYTLPTGSEES